jgi:hypothetical protein
VSVFICTREEGKERKERGTAGKEGGKISFKKEKNVRHEELGGKAFFCF